MEIPEKIKKLYLVIYNRSGIMVQVDKLTAAMHQLVDQGDVIIIKITPTGDFGYYSTDTKDLYIFPENKIFAGEFHPLDTEDPELIGRLSNIDEAKWDKEILAKEYDLK